MAVLMLMEWPGVTGELYDQVRASVRFDQDPPGGGLYHVAAVAEDGLRVVDVWESAAAFQAFVDTRLMPVVKHVGITAEPKVTLLPVRFAFAPALMVRPG